MNGRLILRFVAPVTAALWFVVILAIPAGLAQDKIDSNTFAELRWRSLARWRSRRWPSWRSTDRGRTGRSCRSTVGTWAHDS